MEPPLFVAPFDKHHLDSSPISKCNSDAREKGNVTGDLTERILAPSSSKTPTACRENRSLPRYTNGDRIHASIKRFVQYEHRYVVEQATVVKQRMGDCSLHIGVSIWSWLVLGLVLQVELTNTRH